MCAPEGVYGSHQDLLAVSIDQGKGPLRSPFGLPDMQNISVAAPNRLPPADQTALVSSIFSIRVLLQSADTNCVLSL